MTGVQTCALPIFGRTGQTCLDCRGPEAYACLYKSYGKTVDAIKAEDVTISILREAKPIELFRYLEGHGCKVTKAYEGIYYAEGKTWFPTQIVVTGKIRILLGPGFIGFSYHSSLIQTGRYYGFLVWTDCHILIIHM